MKINRYLVLAISFVGMLLGVILLYVGIFQRMHLLTYVGIGIVVFFLVFRIVFCRCQHCNRFLGKNRGNHCPYCGKPLD